MVSHHGGRAVVIRLVVMAAALTLTACLLTTPAWAATPSSNATCTGSLAPDSSGASAGEPNLLDYTFNCTADVTNYTFVVSRYPGNSNVIDDFEASPLVIQPDGSASSTNTFSCSGGIPGNGFNCNAPTGTPMTAGNSAQGTFDPIDPYCKRLPPGAAPGTPAEPQAQVSLIVTDATGATDGPFTLDLTSACPTVPDTVPYPPPPRPKPTTRCDGKLAKDSSPTTSEPNLLDYRFRCNGVVTAYSVLITRAAHSDHNLNAFAASPLVYLPGGAPSTSASFGCTGVTPGSGFDCLAPSGHAMAAGDTARGTFNPVDPYCKRLPPSGKAGAPAEPQAVVQLVITDATGAQRGPFTMSLRPACPAVPNRVPATGRHHRSSHHARRHRRG